MEFVKYELSFISNIGYCTIVTLKDDNGTEKEYIIGPHLAKKVGRETTNLYKSLSIRGVSLTHITSDDELITTLRERDLINYRAYRVTLVSYTDFINFQRTNSHPFVVKEGAPQPLGSKKVEPRVYTNSRISPESPVSNIKFDAKGMFLTRRRKRQNHMVRRSIRPRAHISNVPRELFPEQ